MTNSAQKVRNHRRQCFLHTLHFPQGYTYKAVFPVHHTHSAAPKVLIQGSVSCPPHPPRRYSYKAAQAHAHHRRYTHIVAKAYVPRRGSHTRWPKLMCHAGVLSILHIQRCPSSSVVVRLAFLQNMSQPRLVRLCWLHIVSIVRIIMRSKVTNIHRLLRIWTGTFVNAF